MATQNFLTHPNFFPDPNRCTLDTAFPFGNLFHHCLGVASSNSPDRRIECNSSTSRRCHYQYSPNNIYRVQSGISSKLYQSYIYSSKLNRKFLTCFSLKLIVFFFLLNQQFNFFLYNPNRQQQFVRQQRRRKSASIQIFIKIKRTAPLYHSIWPLYLVSSSYQGSHVGLLLKKYQPKL